MLNSSRKLEDDKISPFAVVYCKIFHLVFALSYSFRKMIAKGFLRKKGAVFHFLYLWCACGHIYLYKHLWRRIAVLLANLVWTKPFNLQEKRTLTGTGFTEVCMILKWQKTHSSETEGRPAFRDWLCVKSGPASVKSAHRTFIKSEPNNCTCIYFCLKNPILKTATPLTGTVTGIVSGRRIPLKYINALTWQLLLVKRPGFRQTDTCTLLNW